MFVTASWCLRRCLWILPIITLGWIVTGFLTTYTVAVAMNHTFPNFPYISYTGTEVPERGIFTLVASFSAILLAANGEMRFLFVKKFFKINKIDKRWKQTNFAGIVLGLLSALGLLLVACFQVDTMKPPHYFGAFLCFVVAIVYAWLQTAITWKILITLTDDKDKKWHKYTLCAEILNSIVCTALLIIFSVTKTYYKVAKNQGLGTKWDTLRGVFLVSTTSEWALMVSVACFLLTFIPCFRMLERIEMRVTLVERLRQEQQQNGLMKEAPTGTRMETC